MWRAQMAGIIGRKCHIHLSSCVSSPLWQLGITKVDDRKAIETVVRIPRAFVRTRVSLPYLTAEGTFHSVLQKRMTRLSFLCCHSLLNPLVCSLCLSGKAFLWRRSFSRCFLQCSCVAGMDVWVAAADCLWQEMQNSDSSMVAERGKKKIWTPDWTGHEDEGGRRDEKEGVK